MDIYYNNASAPCRAVKLTIAALGLKPNFKVLDILSGETKTPEFMAINPQHCLPTIVDGDLTMWESRAISSYLSSKYGKDDSLYPKDPKKRAMVDRMLYFDMGTMYSRFRDYVYPTMFGGAPVNPDKLVALQEALGWFNSYLDGQKYAAGNNITVADHALAATLSGAEYAGIDFSSHPNVKAWLARCKSNMTGYAAANDVGAKMFGNYAKSKLSA